MDISRPKWGANPSNSVVEITGSLGALRALSIAPQKIRIGRLHPGRLTWNIIIGVWKIIFLSKWGICRFHVNLPGCSFWDVFVLQSPSYYSAILFVAALTGKKCLTMWVVKQKLVTSYGCVILSFVPKISVSNSQISIRIPNSRTV